MEENIERSCANLAKLDISKNWGVPSKGERGVPSKGERGVQRGGRGEVWDVFLSAHPSLLETDFD